MHTVWIHIHSTHARFQNSEFVAIVMNSNFARARGRDRDRRHIHAGRVILASVAFGVAFFVRVDRDLRHIDIDRSCLRVLRDRLLPCAHLVSHVEP